MLARIHRLSEKKDFQKVFLKGDRVSSPFYTMRWYRNAVGAPRFGFVVANKITKKATERNTIRRRLRECVRKNIERLQLGMDVVIIVRPPALGASYRLLEPEIIRSFDVIVRRAAGPMRRGQKQ